MSVGDPEEVRAVREEDVAGIRDAGHDDVRDPAEDLLPVERRGEELARLGEQANPVVGALAVGDLHDHGADPDHLLALRSDRVVAREPVPPVADSPARIVGRLRVHDRLAGLEHAAVERFEPFPSPGSTSASVRPT